MTVKKTKGRTLEEVLGEMKELDESLEYYAITMTANNAGETELSTLTRFEAWGDPEMRSEIRVPDLANPHVFLKIWEELGEEFLIVKNADEWPVFFLRGGHALVEKNVAEEYLRSSLFTPEPSVSVPGKGFVGRTTVVSVALRRAPTPKLRGKVLQRDNRRCRICGRSPYNYVDLEIDVHHIKPWAERGLTIEENLITLCHTCHKGLEPHYDRTLYECIPTSAEKEPFAAGVQRYRLATFTKIQEALKKTKRSRRGVRSGQRASEGRTGRRDAH